jgi:SAM-dependent methyltransferase
MRVLDVGCGAGDVSFLAAKMVGPSGKVIGVDKSAEAIETASKRAEGAQLENVKFMQGSIDEIDLLEPVDAAVGRFVLMYSADPALTLGNIVRNVIAGGVIAFQEMDMTGVKSFPRVPLFQKHTEWIIETFRRGGTEAEMGLKLYSTFMNAGLPAPRMILGARVEGGRDSEGFEILTKTTRNLLPMMEKFGISTPEEVGVETMAKRLRDAVASCRRRDRIASSDWRMGAQGRFVATADYASSSSPVMRSRSSSELIGLPTTSSTANSS